MNKYKIIAICGKSAAGKDSLLQEIMRTNPEVHEIVSCTTRPPREGEVQGKNYYFMSVEEFAHKDCMGEMLEISHFRDWYYGTSIEGLDPNLINVGVFNPTGIWALMHDERVQLYVVRVDATDKERLLRSLSREQNPDVDEIIRRYTTDKEDFEWFSQVCEPDYIFFNGGKRDFRITAVATDIPTFARCLWAEQTN